jgi:hypothetical protein
MPSSCKLQWLYLFRVERVFPDRRLQFFFLVFDYLEKKGLRSCDPNGDAKWMRTGTLARDCRKSGPAIARHRAVCNFRRKWGPYLRAVEPGAHEGCGLFPGEPKHMM